MIDQALCASIQILDVFLKSLEEYCNIVQSEEDEMCRAYD